MKSESMDVSDRTQEASSSVARVLGFLYLGNEGASCDKKLLQSLNIRHILNMATECPNYFAEPNTASPNFIYLKPPCQDISSERFSSFFITGITFIESVRKQQANVLVHCANGSKRSVSMVICYVMYHTKVRLPAARKFVAQRFSVPVPPASSFKQLEWFQKYLEDRGHFPTLEKAPSMYIPDSPGSPGSQNGFESKGRARSLSSQRLAETPPFLRQYGTPVRKNLSIKQFMQDSNKSTVVKGQEDDPRNIPTIVYDANGGAVTVVRGQKVGGEPCLCRIS